MNLNLFTLKNTAGREEKRQADFQAGAQSFINFLPVMVNFNLRFL